MKIYKAISLLLLLFAAAVAEAQTSVSGSVTDEQGNPLAGVTVTIPGTITGTITGESGNFSISLPDNVQSLNFSLVGFAGTEVAVADPQQQLNVVLKPADAAGPTMVTNSYCHNQTLDENIASVSVVGRDRIMKRPAKNVGNTLFGQGLGLTALQGSGHYADYNPTFYVRGLKTLTGESNLPLVLVDGVERSIDNITPYEVEQVTVLKDAAALALYGYKGVNGAINITTRRGRYNSKGVDVQYEHGFEHQVRRPEFVSAADFARAVNEAKINDGSSAYYTDEAIAAYESGRHPELFPNVDWQSETLRDWAHTNNFNITFYGGSKKFRYFTMLNLNGNQGFNDHGDDNPDYRTQNQFSRGSMRSNIDIDLTESTLLTLNVLGTLTEARKTGTNFAWGSSYTGYSCTSIWNALYRTPANAFPVRLSNGYWGGVTDGTALNGTYNPVAIATDAGYIKHHNRSIFVDMNLEQDLSIVTEGLGATFRLAYDNTAYYVENYTRAYDYAFYPVAGGSAVSFDGDGEVITFPSPSISQDSDGNSIATSLSTDSHITSYNRNVSIYGNLFYDHAIGDNQKLYAQLRYDFEKRDSRGVNTTYYYQNVSAYAHYMLADKYIADVTLMGSGHNFFAPDHKWAFSPTVALGWIVSAEDFMQGIDAIDFLKLRASFGRINSSYVPANGYWVQTYDGGPSYYMFDTAYSNPSSTTLPGRMPTPDNSSHEKADKFNVGIEARLLGCLSLVAEGFYENRNDIWVDATNKYSDVLGFTAPYETAGRVVSSGVEVGLDFDKQLGDVRVNLGGKFTFNRSKIKEQYEELKLYSNLETTGKPLGQIFGLESVGFFKDQADIDNSLPQTFTTVRPGDIKYRDINGDGTIDENDVTAIGYNTICPEIYYSFNLGAEWKGLGVSALFQGAANYSAYLNTTSVYRPLVGNTNISTEYYDNRWTPETADAAKYPRLSMESNTNNDRYNTTWVADRSFLKLRSVELYYNLPKSLLEKTKVIKGSRIFVTGTDLACFDKIDIADPEAYGEGYPLTQSVVLGCQIQF